MKHKRGYRRGYPVAVLVGFENDHAVLWHVFSHVVKLHQTLKLSGRRTDERDLYSFHESVVDALRQTLKEGIRSVIVTAPARTTYAKDFLEHVQRHHAYLSQPKSTNRATFALLAGSADQPHKTAELVKTKEFQKLITETTSNEVDFLIETLEKQLHNINTESAVLFSLKEIENRIYDRKPYDTSETRYLILTDKYLADNKDKNRINRLLQIANNKKTKTRIINAETPAGKRISQLGGAVYFTQQNE
jgi:stalled ribosome rescue protein Dom34